MALDLHESARLMASAGWIERRLFELLGRFAVDEPDPVAATMFGVHCHQHAWHADLWRDRMPRIPGVDTAWPPSAPDDLLVALFDTVEATNGTAERLTAIYRAVLPRLADVYAQWSSRLDERVDGPTVRVLTLAHRDDHDQIVAGTREILRVISDAEAARKAAAHLGELEATIVSAGGLTLRSLGGSV